MNKAVIENIGVHVYIDTHIIMCAIHTYAQICVCKYPWLVIPRIKVMTQILPYCFILVTNTVKYFTVYVYCVLYRSLG